MALLLPSMVTPMQLQRQQWCGSNSKSSGGRRHQQQQQHQQENNKTLLPFQVSCFDKMFAAANLLR